MIDWENKIIALVNGELTESESSEVMTAVENSSELQQMLSAYQTIESDISACTEELPSNNLNYLFQKHLEEVQNKSRDKSAKTFSLNPFLKYAAAFIVLFAASVTLWNQMDTKISTEQYAINKILSDMESKTDTEKIKALYINNQPSENNQSKIKQVLIQSLKNDKSSNVRLASVETLTEYIDDEQVRSALIRSLGSEEDPQVQVAIIMALSESKSEEIIKPLEEIINKEGGYKFVKDEAHLGLMNVNSI